MDRLEVSMPIRTILNESNYILWAQEISSFLRGRKLWRYVTGNIREPVQATGESDDKFVERMEEWESKNHQILTWFRNTSIPSIKLQFGLLNTAKEAWDLLASCYSTSDIAHQYQILGNLHRMHQETGQSISNFLSSMHAIWDQLALFEPHWELTADACKFAEYRDRMHAMQFLMALNDEFEPVRASLLHRDPLPHLQAIVSELLTKETQLATLKAQRATLSVSTSTDAVLATFGSSPWRKPYCTHCCRPGHRASNCYQLQSKQSMGTNNRTRFSALHARCSSTAAATIDDSSNSSFVTLSLDDLRFTVRSIIQESGNSSPSALSVTPDLPCKMADNERDKVPMLLEMQHQLSDDSNTSRLQSFASRTRSASISIPMSSMESHENIPNLVGYTGPLRSEKRTPFSQMSGPLYSSHGPEKTFRRNHSFPGSKVAEPQYMKEKLPSFGIKDRIDSSNDHYAAKNEHSLRSGKLEICNDPYCTTSPSNYYKRAQQTNFKSSSTFDPEFHNALYGDAKGWARRFFSYVNAHIPGVMNPRAQVVRSWNKFFVISCLVALFIDPLFFFSLSVQKENMCIILSSPMTTTIVVFRSMMDLIYLLQILLQEETKLRCNVVILGAFKAAFQSLMIAFFVNFLQFRLAYIAPETRVFGAGDLVDDPKRIALNYLRGHFFVDLFVAFPLPQILILLAVPTFRGLSAANYAKYLLCTGVLVQYITRLCRVLPLLAGQSPTGVIFESAWANFVINLLMFVLAGHVVGSCWYLLGLQRVHQCLREACKPNLCRFMDCGHGETIEEFKTNETLWNSWLTNPKATACFNATGGYAYGIYQNGVLLTQEESVVTRYVFSLFWGFQQISTLAGNQTPSYFVWEVLFTLGITGLGFLLFALLIGNIQNFLQALGIFKIRGLELSVRRRGLEHWMSHRRLPEHLRRRVREAERFHRAATRGVNEETLLEDFPEDLQRDIRRHLFKFVKRVRIFALMEDHITDAICEKFRQKTYIRGSRILQPGVLVEKLIFIVRGKIESRGEDGVTCLCEGDICGEELLAWCLESSSVNKDGRRPPGNRLLSNRTVTCVTNVEAFALRAEDLEEVTRLYARFLRNPKVQGAIRYVSPYWRGLAATRIQVAWRYRKKRLSRIDTSQSQHPSP